MSYLFYSILYNKKDMKYRSRIEIIAMILEIVGQGATKTKIMYKAYLSYSQLNQYMSFLIENKLIECKLGSEIYVLTEKGRRLGLVCKELDDMIPYKKKQIEFVSHSWNLIKCIKCDSLTEQNTSQIDAERAKEITRRFLGQYHTVIDAEAVLDNNVWIVTAYLGFSNTQTRQVRIEAYSGKIVSCSWCILIFSC